MRPIAPLVLLALLAVLSTGRCAVGTTAAPAGDTNSTRTVPPHQLGHVLRVCASDSHPVASCNTTTNDPAGFSGYEVELFRDVATRLSWEEGVDYIFRCVGFAYMIQSLERGDGNCDIGMGAITVSTEREAAGITFSYPTYASSLGVLVPAQVQSNNGFFFVQPFSWQVWLAVGLSLLVVPFLAFVVEALALTGRVRDSKSRWGASRLRQAYWEISWLTVQNGTPDDTARSSGTRIMMLAYGMMAIVMVSCYTAQLTAYLTLSKIQTSITSLSELPGRAVGTIETYQPRMLRNGILPIVLPNDNITELGRGGDDWLSILKAGKLDAFVIDEPFVQWIDSVTGCEISQLEGKFEQFDYAIAFARNASTVIDINQFDLKILALQEDGTLDMLRDTFIVIPEPICQVSGSGDGQDASIQWSQVWGLWVVLGSGLALSLVVAAFLTARRRRILRQQSRPSKDDDTELADSVKPDDTAGYNGGCLGNGSTVSCANGQTAHQLGQLQQSLDEVLARLQRIEEAGRRY